MSDIANLQPEYFHEAIPGTLWRAPDGDLGLSLPDAAPPNEADILLAGSVVVRYGVEMLHEYAVLVPGLFESETGYQLAGRAAWDLMWAQFQLYPRAEVIGMRQDGRPGEYWIRELDFADRPRLLAYVNAAEWVSLGDIRRVMGTADALPTLFARYRAML